MNLDLSKCQCSKAGFCSVFKKINTQKDFDWCNRVCEQDRRDYYEVVKNSHFEIKPDPNIDDKALIYHLLRHHKKHKPTQIPFLPAHFFDNDGVTIDESKVKILSLGHHSDQFDDIEDVSYIEKLNLNDIGSSFGPEFAEARIYDLDFDALFPADKEIVGITSASWNNKYNWHKIDEFTEWPSAKYLWRTKDKNTILGGQSDCACWLWDGTKSKVIKKNLSLPLGEEFLGYLLSKFGLEANHKLTLYSNQVIATREKLKELFDFYKKYDILGVIRHQMDHMKWQIEGTKFDFRHDNLNNHRFEAYLTEIITGLWLTNNDKHLIVPNTTVISNWYGTEQVRQRVGIDLSKCHCQCAGMCKIFDRQMDDAGVKWCKSTTEEKRRNYVEQNNPFLLKHIKPRPAKNIEPVDFFDEIPEPTSDYALVVVNVNPYSASHLALTKDSIVEYAKKCGADYIELTGDQCPEFSIYNKFRIHAVTKKYKKTLFMDVDICVDKNAPNIFSLTPDDKISAFVDQGLFIEEEFDLWIRQALQRIYRSGCDDYPAQNKDNQMINSGVLVIPQALADYYQQPIRRYEKAWCFDQMHLSLMLPKDKLNILDVEWNNTIIPNEKKFLEKLDETYFDHLNGGLGVSQEIRLQLMYMITRFDKGDIDKEKIIQNINSKYKHVEGFYSTKADRINEPYNPLYFLTFYDDRENPFCLDNNYTRQILKASAVTKQRVECENFDSVKILSLGHCDEQFSSIKDRLYIEKVDINKLNTGLDNEWAESRIYAMDFDELFGDSEFVGVTTASWNLKYVGLNPIDLFHKWDAAKLLVAQKRKDILLGAQSDCMCVLINRKEPEKGWFYQHFVDFDVEKFAELLKDLKLFPTCERTLFSNQIIGHRDTVKQLFDFYKDKDVLSKIEKCAEGVKIAHNKYTNKIPAYLSEYITALWIANQDLTVLPQECFNNYWYQPENMKKRLDWTGN